MTVVDQLTRRDEPAAAASLAAAFAEYGLFPSLCPDPVHRPRVIEAFCRFLVRSAVRVGGCHATPDRAAVVCAWPPGREWPTFWDQLRGGGLALAWRMGWRATRLLMRLEHGFDAARRKHVPGPHWYVNLVGVRPDSQGKGLSRVVMGPIFEAADRDRVPIYLETLPEANVPIYRKLGFELMGHETLEADMSNWCLRRDPR